MTYANLRWYVVHSQPNAENKAVVHLGARALRRTCRVISNAGGTHGVSISFRPRYSHVIFSSRSI